MLDHSHLTQNQTNFIVERNAQRIPKWSPNSNIKSPIDVFPLHFHHLIESIFSAIKIGFTWRLCNDRRKKRNQWVAYRKLCFNEINPTEWNFFIPFYIYWLKKKVDFDYLSVFLLFTELCNFLIIMERG